ncbi:hypothetical protein MYCTH_2311850 [Thermothelomyces thermophilus ATCC 42464]|uniref:INO80 complex subunit B-like conserved region domain-containing protein n=1 Tax=Thermothelomyces thermophilus (strain ATCC 42464 / BCRC 31852 / DSM 1799) TaxID=573729 RepID=G2QPQ6_THET4|nr:uncharacterized protein MYCTH_2311850 [Thermothelomyces thermophilus ATCC 42464]AEO61569.1 hypothetical protein MYCTH_2311850 [Thermothelomyces thermophilus ATCC 42464]
MSSRPRRSAAQRATAAITDMADRDRETSEPQHYHQQQQQRTMSSRSSRRSGGGNGIASVARGAPSSSPPSSTGAGDGGVGGQGIDDDQHIHLTLKLPSNKLRQATGGSSTSAGTGTSNGKRKLPGSATATGGASGDKGRAGVADAGSKRARGGKKNYVIDSSEEEDDEQGEEDEEDEAEDDEEEEGSEIEVEVAPRNFAKGRGEEEEEEEDGDERMEDPGEDDAEGDDDGDEMDVDAEGDEDDDQNPDADGDVDMDVTPTPKLPAIKVTKPSKNPSTPSKVKGAHVTKPTAKGSVAAKKPSASNDDEDGEAEEDEDEELSELESEPEDVTVQVANGEEDAEGDEEEDVDAEGEEEIEVADEDAEGDEDDGLESDEEEGTSRADTPDLSKLTARQRAKLGDVSHEYMKLSDGKRPPLTSSPLYGSRLLTYRFPEVQAKKHFTAEELSMRRAEMARRRRNLSEKRNEEVKMETINKLLKKQAPKTNRKTAALMAAEETPETDTQRVDPMLIRWVNNKNGSIVAVPDELLSGPVGKVFVTGGTGPRGKMVEEVS